MLLIVSFVFIILTAPLSTLTALNRKGNVLNAFVLPPVANPCFARKFRGSAVLLLFLFAVCCLGGGTFIYDLLCVLIHIHYSSNFPCFKQVFGFLWVPFYLQNVTQNLNIIKF